MNNNPLSFYAKVDNKSFQYETGKITRKAKEENSSKDIDKETNRMLKVEHEVGKKETTELNGLFSQQDIGVTKTTRDNSQNIITKKSLILDSEQNLSLEDQVKKKVLEKVLSQFNISSQDVKMIPSDSFSFSYEQVTQKNLEGYATANPSQFSYTEVNEHYEKIEASFNGKISFDLGDETIEMDLNLSYSREFYIQNQESIGTMEQNLAEKQLVIDGKGFEDSIKNLDSISVSFDALTELENTRNKVFFEYLSRLFQKDEIRFNNNLSDSKVFMQNQSHDYVAVGVIKEGSSVYLSTSERVSIST